MLNKLLVHVLLIRFVLVLTQRSQWVKARTCNLHTEVLKIDIKNIVPHLVLTQLEEVSPIQINIAQWKSNVILQNVTIDKMGSKRKLYIFSL